MYLHSMTIGNYYKLLVIQQIYKKGNNPIQTEDGFNIQFISNYLGHFLLTNLLLDILKKNNARIINVTSSTHKLSTYFLKKLNKKN